MKWLLLSVCILWCAGAYASPEHMGRVRIVVVPVFNGKELKIGNDRYVDANGDSMNITEFRFYLSHFCIGENVYDNVPAGYHLVDAADTATTVFIINNVTSGVYNELQFAIGVDSALNVAGALSGDLDPVRGMYWAWNTGYIMAKLEGHSKACKTLHHEFQFHIGGYLPPYSAERKINLPLPQQLIVKDGEVTTIILQADVAAWFNGKTVIDLAKVNDVVTPSAQSMAIADNYTQMFSVVKVVAP